MLFFLAARGAAVVILGASFGGAALFAVGAAASHTTATAAFSFAALVAFSALAISAALFAVDTSTSGLAAARFGALFSAGAACTATDVLFFASVTGAAGSALFAFTVGASA